MTEQKKLLALMLASSMAVIGCSSTESEDTDASDESVTGLSMPTKLSVVTAAEETNASKVSGINLNYKAIAGALVTDTTLASFPTDSDYKTDESNTWVYDRSIESLGMVNEILCLMDQTKATEMVNQGAYVALVNEDKCSQERDNSASTGAQSGVTTTEVTEYNRWVVESTRTDNDSPQLVKIWIPGEPSAEHPMDGQNILVETTITEGVSATKPFGAFVLNFKGVVDGGVIGQTAGTWVPVMQGTLKTVEDASGKPSFQLINLAGSATGLSVDFSFEEKAAVLLDDAAGTSGVAKTAMSSSWPCQGCDQDPMVEQSSFSVAFNATHFLRGEDTDAVAGVDERTCTDRNAFTTQTWRYNIYHTAAGTFNGRAVTAGERVALNSGFPFIYTDANNEEYFGHVGYWGVWTEDDLSLTELDGKTIQKQAFGDAAAAAETYTVKVSDGKARMRVKNQATLTEVADITFNWYNGWEVPDSTLPQNQQYAVRVNSSGTGFEAYASVAWGENGPVETALPSAVDVTPGAANNSSSTLWMWSDQLGGSATFEQNATYIVYYKESNLAASEVSTSVTLYCYERCPKGVAAAVNATQESDLYYTDSLSPWSAYPSQPTRYEYELAAVNGVLTLTDLQNSEAVLAPGSMTVCETPEQTGCLPEWYQWGIGTGVMGTTVPTEWWQMQSQDTTYVWETGTQSWNRLVTIVDSSNAAVDFDKPLKFQYQYALGDDPNGDNFAAGTPFMLEYGGPGQLWGFPWQPEPGCDASTENCRWVSALTFKDGVELSDGSNSFVVRAMEKEQQMAEVDLTACGALNVDNIGLDLPTAVDGQVSILWTDRPSVTNPPAVIEGELQ